MQSTMSTKAFHVAIVMDGNGRWAVRRGLPRIAGHKVGVTAVRRIVEAAPALGITMLTLFAFSSDNWRRPPAEVGALMRMLRRYLGEEAATLAQNDVRLSVIGRRDRLPEGLAADIARVEDSTAAGQKLHVRIAVDYSARDAILRAAAAWASAALPTREAFGRLLAGESAADVDLLIRSGGEQRLSDFLLWECAYAEFAFAERMWPDFGPDDLGRAVAGFRGRDRRFGGLSDQPRRDAGPATAPAQSMCPPPDAASDEETRHMSIGPAIGSSPSPGTRAA